MKTNCRNSLLSFFILSVLFANAQVHNTDSLARIIKSGPSEALRMHAKVLLASEIIPANMDSAFSLLQKASRLAESSNPHHKADYFNTVGVYYWFSGDFEAAIEQFVKITKLEETPEMYINLARAYNNAGTLFARLRVFDSAHIFLSEALRIDYERDNKPGMAKTNYDLSVLNYRQGRYELALKYQLESIKTNEAESDSMRLIYGYNVLGNIYWKLKDFDNAEASYLRALNLSRAVPQNRQESIVLNNLSAMFCNIPEKFDVAIEYANQGLEAIERDNKPDLQAYLLANIGGAYDAIQNYSKAFYYYHLARELLETQAFPSDLDRLYINIANLQISLDNVDSAYYYAKKAQELTGPEGSPDNHSKILMTISKGDSIRGEYYSALTNYQQAIALRDSVWNFGNKNRIAELRIIHETDMKAAENQLLLKQNQLKTRVIKNQRYLIYATGLTVALIILLLLREYAVKRKILAQKKEIDKKNEELTELNKTKDKFFSIIAHDLRGPISALESLLELAHSEFEIMDDAQKIQIIQTLKLSSTNTCNLLDNLLDWAQAQTGKIENNPEKFDLCVAVNEVFGFLGSRASLKNQKLQNEISDGTFVLADKQLVKNILINIINNAIKFSRHDSLIRIAGSENGKERRVSIIDQGIGINENKINKLFCLDSGLRSRGTNNEPGTGLGLIMVHEYLQIIGGKIFVESKFGKGTTFTFTIPAS